MLLRALRKASTFVSGEWVRDWRSRHAAACLQEMQRAARMPADFRGVSDGVRKTRERIRIKYL